VHAVADTCRSFFALVIHVALVGVDIPAGIGRVQYVFKMQGVVLAGGTDLDFRMSSQRLSTFADS
jgi:hypothetical protein